VHLQYKDPGKTIRSPYYNLVQAYRTVLFVVEDHGLIARAPHSDMIRRGFITEGGLITRCRALISLIFALI